MVSIFFVTTFAFILGSEAYHDYYRWPMRDKKTFETWKAETSWGRLFSAYENGTEGSVMRAPPGDGAREARA